MLWFGPSLLSTLHLSFVLDLHTEHGCAFLYGLPNGSARQRIENSCSFQMDWCSKSIWVCGNRLSLRKLLVCVSCKGIAINVCVSNIFLIPSRPKRTLNSKKYGVDLIRYTHTITTVLHCSTKVDGKYISNYFTLFSFLLLLLLKIYVERNCSCFACCSQPLSLLNECFVAWKDSYEISKTFGMGQQVQKIKHQMHLVWVLNLLIYPGT